MTEGPLADADTLRVGMLMESAQIHQRLAETHIDKLSAHTQDLDQIVREQIRRSFTEELRWLAAEADDTTRALRTLRTFARTQSLVVVTGVIVLGVCIQASVAHWLLPSPVTVEKLSLQREALEKAVADLEQRGGRADWKRCGEARRLCVRVDRSAPGYGEAADFYVVKEH